MSAQGNANLSRLADYLEALPEGPEGHFDMQLIIYNPSDVIHLGSYASAEPLGCGTVACALGHAPQALPDIPPGRHEPWAAYAERVFDSHDWPHGAGWWVFHASWKETDNTAKGAAARIRYMLANGVPDDAPLQRRGRAPLSYKVPA